MGLQREFEVQGQWLFRWRGLLPFLFNPVIALAVADTTTCRHSITTS